MSVKFENGGFSRYDSIGLLHSTDGPSRFSADGTMEYYTHGLFMKRIIDGESVVDISACSEQQLFLSPTTYYLKSGKLHHATDPAATAGNMRWWASDGKMFGLEYNGKFYEVDGDRIEPTNRIFPDMTETCKKSKLDPTIKTHQKKDSMTLVDIFGRYHNPFGPSMIRNDGYQQFWNFGVWIKSVDCNGVVYEIAPDKNPTGSYYSVDATTRVYNMNRKLSEVMFSNGDYQKYIDGVLIEETVAGKNYTVANGVHTAHSLQEPLVNMKRFKQLFPEAQIEQTELDETVNDLLKRFYKPKPLDPWEVFVEETLMSNDEVLVWTKYRNYILKWLKEDPINLIKLSEKFGFVKPDSLIRYWMNKYDNYAALEEIRVHYWTYCINEVATDDCVVIVSLPPYHIVIDWIKTMLCEDNIDWKKIVAVCFRVEFGFGSLLNVVNQQYWKDKPKKLTREKLYKFLFNEKNIIHSLLMQMLLIN
jgi:hypothetical protein